MAASGSTGESRVPASMCGTRRQQSLILYRRMRFCRMRGDDSGWMTARSTLFSLYEKQATQYGYRLVKKNTGLSLPDAIQESRLGVVEAIDRWEPERGDLLVLVFYLVRSRIQRFVRSETLIRCPRTGHVAIEQESHQEGDITPLESIHVTSFECFETDEGGSVPEWLLADPEDRIGDWLQKQSLCSAVAHLPPEQREAVVLHYGLGDGKYRTYREVGELLGRSHVAVRSRVEAALPKLARLLGDWS